MADCYAVIKYETRALPHAFGWGHLLQIIQYAALEVENLGKPLT